MRISDWSSYVCSSDLVQLRGVLGRTGDDQRRARLVDQDRVDFVDDRVMQAALVALFLAQRHVVAQVVEAEFVVGAVGDVGRIGRMLVGDRKSAVLGKSVSVQVDVGGGRIIKKK